MTLKKTLIALLITVSLTTFVAAQDAAQPLVQPRDTAETTVNATDEAIEESRVTNTALGSRIRLYQLENALNRAVITGQETLNVLGQENSQNLTDTLASLMELRGDVQERLADNTTIKPEDYIVHKERSRSLVQRFKTEARPLLQPGERAFILQEVRDDIREAQRENRLELRNAIKQYNQRRATTILEQAGLNPAQRFDQNTTRQQIVERVKQRIQQLPPHIQRGVAQRIQEQQVRERIRSREAVQAYRDNPQTVRERQEVREQRDEIRKRIADEIAERREKLREFRNERRDQIRKVRNASEEGVDEAIRTLVEEQRESIRDRVDQGPAPSRNR
jgi:hypothetical protein